MRNLCSTKLLLSSAKPHMKTNILNVINIIDIFIIILQLFEVLTFIYLQTILIIKLVRLYCYRLFLPFPFMITAVPCTFLLMRSNINLHKLHFLLKNSWALPNVNLQSVLLLTLRSTKLNMFCCVLH